MLRNRSVDALHVVPNLSQDISVFAMPFILAFAVRPDLPSHVAPRCREQYELGNDSDEYLPRHAATPNTCAPITTVSFHSACPRPQAGGFSMCST
jgi:hypothetical protein